ncbi:ATP-grasp fold amidoligase family protein [Aerococcus urinaeequi]|uniref:ATP-grasp fold amidoligase family protein n=1 Tax=Aerococcus urinaeequi TaxID=51665 RepID=UPI003EDADE7A
MDYKKIIKNPNVRYKILDFLSFIPDEVMLKAQYKIKLNRKLNLEEPKRFTEKLQWYKLNYRDPIMSDCVDKYKVRNYVKGKGLEHTLTKLYQVVDNVNDINYGNLPNEFVVKSTNGGGGLNVMICRDKVTFNIENYRPQFETWLASKRETNFGREWVYDNLEPKIIIEELLKENNNQEINDYKFLCFNGSPKYVICDIDRYTNHRRNIYDVNWNFLDISTDVDTAGNIIDKPETFKEMIKVAKKLSEDFPFVRVDLYSVNEKVYFGELTFFPWSGYVQFSPDEFDFQLGEQFVISDKN